MTQETCFDYYRGMEAEQYTFYRIPKILFTEEQFKCISCEAKVLYGLLLDRMALSVKNRWLDDEDRVYIIFPVEEIAEFMNCGTQKAVKLLKELDTDKGVGLIEKRRLGLGKPNVIYVKNFMKKLSGEVSKEEKEPERLENTQNCENHNSRIVKTTIQESAKSQCNNTDINKTEYSDTDIINQSYLIHQENKGNGKLSDGDAMDRIDACRQVVRENISYECFLDREEIRREVDELVDLMTEVLLMPDEGVVRIAGEDKPANIVKEQFLKLRYSHIEYVQFCMQQNTSKVRNIKTYLLTALYNSPMTIGHYYQAEVRHDLYGKSG